MDDEELVSDACSRRLLVHLLREEVERG